MLVMHGSHNAPPRDPPPDPEASVRLRPVRIALVGTAPLDREGLKLVLENAGFSVVVEAEDLSGIGSGFAGDTVPELFIIDVPGEIDPGDWHEDLGALRQRFRDSRIVLLSARPTAEWWSICWHTDLDGYLSKLNRATVIKRQLGLILAGERVFPFDILHESVTVHGTASPSRHDAGGRASLSPSDAQILRYLLAGYPNKAIAERLRITESTVKARMKSVFQKIHAANRTQAAVWALKRGIKSIDDTA
jgi:DNA-binding NarL/FixJ family response regulator